MLKAYSKKAFHIFMAVLFMLLISTSVGMAFSRTPPVPEYVPGQILVKFHENISGDEINRILSEQEATILKTLARTGVYLVILPDNVKVNEAVEKFTSYPEVQYAEPNYRVKLLEK
jgi:thermitase